MTTAESDECGGARYRYECVERISMLLGRERKGCKRVRTGSSYLYAIRIHGHHCWPVAIVPQGDKASSSTQLTTSSKLTNQEDQYNECHAVTCVVTVCIQLPLSKVKLTPPIVITKNLRQMQCDKEMTASLNGRFYFSSNLTIILSTQSS